MKDIFTDIGFYVGAAIAVTGFIQFVKGIWDKAPGCVWAIALVLSVAGFMLAPDIVRQGILILAIAQLGYETLIQPVKKRL